MAPNPRFSRTDFSFLIFIILLLAAYAVHLLSFTLFEGFSTFSNDAGSYITLARKWSPYFAPGDVEIFQWPIQIFPPGFAWALAITGASESLWLSHLFVSMCMLASIGLVGWMIYTRAGWLIGGLLVIALCLLPGVVISSMGILSENFYLLLSLALLLVYSRLRERQDNSWAAYVLLLLLLTLTLLTRSVGFALVAAIALVTLLDSERPASWKKRVLITAFLSLALWFAWDLINPQKAELTYGFYAKQTFGNEFSITGVLKVLWNNASVNFMRILFSWNHYFALSYRSLWLFLCSYGLFLVCISGFVLRLLQLRVDAVYLAIYCAILLVWPYPDEMNRFIHPIMFLLILQPVLYALSRPGFVDRGRNRAILAVVVTVFIANSLFIQSGLRAQRQEAFQINPDLVHSYELYDSSSREFGLQRATGFTQIMKYIEWSAQYVPTGGVVATVKPGNYSLLTDRRAVTLVTTVPFFQQLCNLRVANVDRVFLSKLTSDFNEEGIAMIGKFFPVSSDIWKLNDTEGNGIAYTVAIDRDKLDAKLREEDFDCRSFKLKR